MFPEPSSFRTLVVRNATSMWGRNKQRKRRRRSGEVTTHLRSALYQGEAAPWSSPPATAHVALLFFGKIGTLHNPASYVGRDQGDEATVRLAHRSVRRHVLDANPLCKVDVFIHSWNPSLAKLMDVLYKPVWSAHEAQVHDHRVPSAALSLQRVLAAKVRHEKVGRPVLGAVSLASPATAVGSVNTYDLAVLCRHDLVFFAPLALGAMPRAQVWIPQQCCGADTEGVHGGGDYYAKPFATVQRTCHAEAGTMSELCRVRSMLRAVGGSRSAQVANEAMYNYWVNDWLLVAPSRTADSFGVIYDRLPAYRAALAEVGISVEWMHFFWAAHVHHAINASGGALALPQMRADVHFTLARQAASERLCVTNVSVVEDLPTWTEPMWGGMQARLCPARGQVACKWTSLRCSADTPAATF